MKLKPDNIIKKTFYVSTSEGIFAQIYMGMALGGSIFITKFALLLEANPMQIGLLFAMGHIAAIFQILGIYVSNGLPNLKTTVVRLCFIGRSLTILIAFIPFFVPKQYAMNLMLLIFFFSVTLQAITGNMWMEWIASNVPNKLRGRFFSFRQQFLLVTSLFTGYFFGVLLDIFQTEPNDNVIEFIKNALPFNNLLVSENLPYAFLLLFAFAVMIGISGLNILHYQPERIIERKRIIGLKVMLAAFKDKNFRLLLIFWAWWMAAVGIGSPFWQPFMINNLKMSLYQIQFYGTISALSSLIFLRYWGKFIDKYGNKNTMTILIVLGTINPVVWLFAKEGAYWFLFIEAITSGMMWSGVGIVSMNFAMAVAPVSLRQLYIGLYGAVGGVTMAATSLLSGKFYPESREILGLNLLPEQILFALSAFFRASALIPLLLVSEPGVKSMAFPLNQSIQFAKVFILRFNQWFNGRTK